MRTSKISTRILVLLLTLSLVLGSAGVSFGTDGDVAQDPVANEQVVPGEGTDESEEEVTPEEPVIETEEPQVQAAPVLMAQPATTVKSVAPAAVSRTTAAYTANPQKGKGEVRGLWIGFCDFKALGLTNKDKATYTANLDKILNEAKKYGVNTVYFHARAFDDATWESTHFPANEDLNTRAARGTSAAATYSYDPLKIAITEAHERGMELHAWLNPYRVTYDYFLDPSEQSSIDRVLLAVDEILALRGDDGRGVDGIHFDDYFYHAKRGYKKVGNVNAVTASLSSTVYKAPGPGAKRFYVNELVKQVYNTVHSYPGKAFGISPAGNWENCMNDGADVEAWLAKTGYVDYLAPQIYWTDQWGTKGTTKMFTNRMNLFKSHNKAGIPMYIGLAAYRTGYAQTDDRGWGWYNNNLATQVTKLRSAGMDGWILFSAPNLTMARCKTEMANLHALLFPVWVNNPVTPGNMKVGSYFTVGGYARSDEGIRRIEAGIVSKNTGKWVKGHYYNNASLNTTMFNLANVSNAMDFDTLPGGRYFYRVWVHDKSGVAKMVINKEFQITAPFTVSLSKLKAPGTIKRGKGYGIKGTISASSKINRVEVGIVNSTGTKWLYRYDNQSVNAWGFNIKRADSAMKFRKLKKGTYYYRIWVHTDNGTKLVVNKKFKVK